MSCTDCLVSGESSAQDRAVEGNDVCGGPPRPSPVPAAWSAVRGVPGRASGFWPPPPQGNSCLAQNATIPGRARELRPAACRAYIWLTSAMTMSRMVCSGQPIPREARDIDRVIGRFQFVPGKKLFADDHLGFRMRASATRVVGIRHGRQRVPVAGKSAGGEHDVQCRRGQKEESRTAAWCYVTVFAPDASNLKQGKTCPKTIHGPLMSRTVFLNLQARDFPIRDRPRVLAGRGG